jgi:hypothetical protein
MWQHGGAASSPAGRAQWGRSSEGSGGAAAAAVGSSGDSGGGLLWSDDEGLVGYSMEEDDDDAGSPAITAAAAGAAATLSEAALPPPTAATAGDGRGGPQKEGQRAQPHAGPLPAASAAQQAPQPQQQQQPQLLRQARGGAETLAAVLLGVPSSARGRFRLPPGALLTDSEGGAAAGMSRPGRGEAPAPPPLAEPRDSAAAAAGGDVDGWPAEPQAVALLLQARDIGSFEQAVAFTQRYAAALGPQHMAMLWCRLRQLLLPAWGEEPAGAGAAPAAAGPASVRWVGAGARAPPPRRGIPPVGMAALTQAAALTVRCGRELPPLGAAAALAALAAARARGFDPARLQAHVLRRLKAQLRDVVAAGAPAATPQQLGEALLALCELGWRLQGPQLGRVTGAAAGMLGSGSGGGGGSGGAQGCSPEEAGLLLAALAQAEALGACHEGLAPGEGAPLAAALFDAYAKSLIARGASASASGDGSVGGAQEAQGAGAHGSSAGAGDGPAAAAAAAAAAGGAAAAVLQALSTLPGAPALLAPRGRAAALEALLEMLQAAMPALSGPQLAAAAVALHTLGVEPWEPWCAALHGELARPGRLAALSGPLACALLRALPELAPAPPPADSLVASLARCASGRLQECAPAELAAAPLGLLAARHRPPNYWLDAYWAASAAADWRAAPPMDVAGMAAAVGWLARERRGGGGSGSGSGAAPPGWCERVAAALGADGLVLPPPTAAEGPRPESPAAAAQQQQQPQPQPQQQQRRRGRLRQPSTLPEAHLRAALVALAALSAPPPQAAAGAGVSAEAAGRNNSARGGLADDPRDGVPLFPPDGDTATLLLAPTAGAGGEAGLAGGAGPAPRAGQAWLMDEPPPPPLPPLAPAPSSASPRRVRREGGG